jgi:predicted nucleic acid-binding protein
VIYLDTGCLLKLYYPERESARVAGRVAGDVIAFLALHELELLNALELKLYRTEATRAQVRATAALVEQDVRSGVLYRTTVPWEDVLEEAALAAKAHTRKFGCRSLDMLHCAAARSLAITSFITADARQRRFAERLGLRCPAIWSQPKICS